MDEELTAATPQSQSAHSHDWVGPWAHLQWMLQFSSDMVGLSLAAMVAAMVEGNGSCLIVLAVGFGCPV